MIPLATSEEVDPLLEKTEMDPLPVTSRSTSKSDVATGLASSPQNASTITPHSETAPANSTQEINNDFLAKMVNDAQEEVKSIKQSIEDVKEGLKTSFEEELDLLAESVSAFTSRISEVDALKLEVKTLKRRLQRLEQGKSSFGSSHVVDGVTKEPARLSRLAQMSRIITKKPKMTDSTAVTLDRRSLDLNKRAEESLKAKAPEKASLKKFDSLETTISPRKFLPRPRVNEYANGEIDSQFSSTDTESHVSPIPAARPEFARFLSPSSSISDISAVALEFESKPTPPQFASSKRKLKSTASLNRAKAIPSSDKDEEEEVYKPQQARRGGRASVGRGGLVPSRGVRRVGRPSKIGSRTSKELVQKPNRTWSGRRGIVRRGVSGRVWGVRNEPKRRVSTPNLEVYYTADGQRVDLKGRPVNDQGIPLRSDGRPDRRYLPKTVRDQNGVLRYSAVDGDPKRRKSFPLDDASKKDSDINDPREKIALLDETSESSAADRTATSKSALLKKALELNTDNKPASTGKIGQVDPPPPSINLKRAHSEGRTSVDDDLDSPTAKRLREDDTEIRDEDIAELNWRWGIRQQSA